MKTLFGIIILLLLQSPVQGQNFLEKMKNKVNNIGKSGTADLEKLTIADVDQAKLAEAFTSKQYTRYKYSTSQIKICAADGSQELFFKKNTDGAVEAIYYGNASTSFDKKQAFLPVYSESPLVKKYTSGSGDGNLIFHNNTIINYKRTSNGLFIQELYGASIPYKLVNSYIAKVEQLHLTAEKEGKKVRSDKFEKDRAAKKAEEEKFLAEEKIRRAKYSLENKVVTKIEVSLIEKLDRTIRPKDTRRVGITVTLADGTIMKSKNLGGNLYPQDIMVESNVGRYAEINALGAAYKPKSSNTRRITIGLKKSYSYEPQHNGQVVFTFKPKYKGTTSTTLSMEIKPLDGNLVIDARGRNGASYERPSTDGGDATDGQDMTISVKKIKADNTIGYTYWAKWTIGNQTKYSKFTGKLDIDARGGYGGEGSMGKVFFKGGGKPPKGGDGGNGGDGADCTIILDPSASGLSYDIKLQPGVGGQGLRGAGCDDCAYGEDGEHGKDGKIGKEGTLTKKVEKVNFD
jgi:hypothetical protein